MVRYWTESLCLAVTAWQENTWLDSAWVVLLGAGGGHPDEQEKVLSVFKFRVMPLVNLFLGSQRANAQCCVYQ